MKILQFTTYSLAKLDHGGKIRSHYIKQALKTFSAIETMSFSWEQCDSLSGFDVNLSSPKYAAQGGHHLLGDIAIDEYLQTTEELYENIGNKIKEYSPTHILFEEPFLWPVFLRLEKDGYFSKKIKIIYSAYNIESRLKRKIYSDFLPKEKAESMTSRVLSIESGVAKRADLILTVSKDDACFLREVNQSSPVVVVPNGNDKAENYSRLDCWNEKFKVEDGTNWLFVGSWHPPNINGLVSLHHELLESHTKLNFKIWILGSVANGLEADPRWNHELSDNFKLVGPVSIEDLDGAVSSCDGIILPIWEGGGSNLKTSQALISDKQVIATSFSFRGFEEYDEEEGVLMVDTVNEFTSALQKTKPSTQTFNRKKCIDALTWDGILKGLVSDKKIVSFFNEVI